ncbi:M15 family metallopeptidase [Pseudoxanthomonas sp.]|uniref:M15 family metallopeptidase n=1 Tax=Pseudoxanthomonas sp. TaxID=1871049 RepID=UPI00261085AB|nr:M15 family metallopeptidase [Pseudoxanthomonas sp.]WDS38183.1 MAG: M15 family metallopeptidase [Pseudoxanthomonas sp.]
MRVSPATTAAQADLVDIATLAPDVQLEIRYAGEHNFTGAPVEGYGAAKCLLLAPVARALAQVQADLRTRGLGLKLFDCYRPVRAVQAFVRWAGDLSDQRMKAEFYPALDKARIIPDGYVAEVSGHSRGATVDLTLVRCTHDHCEALDMGTPFDFFDPRAHTDAADITAAQRDHRRLLLEAMRRRGFANYPKEWWHYTFQPEPTPHTLYDVPVR